MAYAYEELKQNKICVACKVNTARTDRVICLECFEKEQFRQKKRTKRYKNFICFGCSSHIPYSQETGIERTIKNRKYMFCQHCYDFCSKHNCNMCHDIYMFRGFVRDCLYNKKESEKENE